MKVKFHDRRAIRLGTIKLGQVAVGISEGNAEKLYTRIYLPTAPESSNKPIIELTNLSSQYADEIRDDEVVRLLEDGESFEIFR